MGVEGGGVETWLGVQKAGASLPFGQTGFRSTTIWLKTKQKQNKQKQK